MMIGLDASAVAINHLRDKLPHLADYLLCGKFEDFKPASNILFDYIVAIQVFQHGTTRKTHGYFAKVRKLLRPGGLLFLRVNSVSTDIYHKHTTIVEKEENGDDDNDGNGNDGFTIRYDAGPKRCLHIHFFSKQELVNIFNRNGFEIISGPFEIFTTRSSSKTGSWAQWEAVVQKKRAR